MNSSPCPLLLQAKEGGIMQIIKVIAPLLFLRERLR
jgi:hypothetical protein